MLTLLLLAVIAVMGYYIYTIKKSEISAISKFDALSKEILELPPWIISQITLTVKMDDLLGQITGGHLSRLGDVAKRAEEVAKARALAKNVITTNKEEWSSL